VSGARFVNLPNTAAKVLEIRQPFLEKLSMNELAEALVAGLLCAEPCSVVAGH
jgi:hypothetical protein